MKQTMKMLAIAVLALILSTPVNGIAEPGQRDEAMSDTWLQAKLVTTYALNQNLSIFDIDVDVRDQIAHLGGTVDSNAKKELAAEIAKSVDGIKNVENKIVVLRDFHKGKGANSQNSSSRSYGQVISDLTTTASVKAKLLTDSNVDGLKVNVDTLYDQVTLSGTVPSKVERELIEKLAMNTTDLQITKGLFLAYKIQRPVQTGLEESWGSLKFSRCS